MQSKQYFTKIKNYPHEKSTEPLFLLAGILDIRHKGVLWYFHHNYRCDTWFYRLDFGNFF